MSSNLTAPTIFSIILFSTATKLAGKHELRVTFDWSRTLANAILQRMELPKNRRNLEGAGGIGGLLSRSHAYQSGSGSFTNHNYYHADGNGNVTYMVDTNQSMVASYRYDPFGNTISSSGTLSGVNVYRFSSKERHANSGMYYYGYRFYDPNLQRWLNRDPINEFGFKVLTHRRDHLILREERNLYRFVANSPMGSTDKWGLAKDPKCLANCWDQLAKDQKDAQIAYATCLGNGLAGCRKAAEKFPEPASQRICMLAVFATCGALEIGLQDAAWAAYAGCRSGCPDLPPPHHSPEKPCPNYATPIGDGLYYTDPSVYMQ